MAGVLTWKDIVWYAYLWITLTFILSFYFNQFMKWAEKKARREEDEKCTTFMEQ